MTSTGKNISLLPFSIFLNILPAQLSQVKFICKYDSRISNAYDDVLLFIYYFLSIPCFSDARLIPIQNT